MCGAGAGFGSPPRIDSRKARWQSGHAAACKAVYAGSIPTLASNQNNSLRAFCSRSRS